MPTRRFVIFAIVLMAHALAGLMGHAQSNGPTPDPAGSHHHHHYQLIDLGTFGGPNSSFPGSIESINPGGTVTGCADTAVLDSDLAIQHPFFGDPYVERASTGVSGRIPISSEELL